MSEKPRAVLYAREKGSDPDAPYEEKFADLIRLCEEHGKRRNDLPRIVRPDGTPAAGAPPKAQIVMVAYPSILGDDYEEIVESLNLLADAGLRLVVCEPEDIIATKPKPTPPPKPSLTLVVSGKVT